MILDALHKVANHKASLTREEARAAMTEILSGGATDVQIAALAVALHMKGETVEEIVGFAEAIRTAATPLKFRMPLENPALYASGTERDALVDTCGTGGDVSGTFNISTATALVVAGAGVRVAKHGNRSVTSQCGSADVLEALGVKVTLPPERIAECLREVGIVFLFAQAMHPAMKFAQPARRELKLLGPLTNPAGASAEVVGVYDEPVVEKLAAALRMLGVTRALVVHGSDGLDEITITGETKVAEARPRQLLVYKIAPEQFGIERAPLKEILGGDVKVNAEIIRAVLKGEKSARRNVVLLNAAAALVAAGRADDLNEALPIAAQSIDSGAAREKLEKLTEFTNRA